MAPRAQGQIGAQVYHLAGALAIEGPALELQPWNAFPNSGPEPDIDGRGDLVMVDSTIYSKRISGMTKRTEKATQAWNAEEWDLG